MGTHEQTTAHRDHLWVAVIIAACALLEVWATWLGLGSVSGFPKLGRMTTGWILPVTTEAYWAYALYAWLAGAPGPRSRKFAMWTAAAMFVLSLLGQESGHLTAGQAAPVYVVAFVTALPLISLALIAVLVHLRQADREEIAAQAEAKAKAERHAAMLRAEADERTALRAEIAEMQETHSAELAALTGQLDQERSARKEAQESAALRAAAETARDEAQAAEQAAAAALETAENARSEAEQRAAKAEAEAARLARKVDRAAGGKSAAGKGRSTPATAVPSDFDARAEALLILSAEPDISGRELGERVRKSERWGQQFKKDLAGHVAGGGETADS